MSTPALVKPHKRDSSAEGEVIMTESLSEGDSSMEVASEKGIAALPQFQYSREQLMIFNSSPLSKMKPDCLDPAFYNSRGVWDPDCWRLDRKRSETPPDEDRGSRNENADTHKRSGDPRERIRKEQDGIVLSPQRRSFNSGCFVTQAQPISRRPESPMSKTDRERETTHREMPSRRIGSGRILTRDVWDYREKEQEQVDFSFQRSNSNSGSSNRDDRFERRSFGRDFERERDKDRHRNERSRYSDRRRAFSDSREEEPEWFSGGPTSQNDTIELRGFEDIPEENVAGRNSKRGSQNKSGKTGSRSGNRKISDSTPPQGNTIVSRTPTPTGGQQNVPVPTTHSPIAEESSSSDLVSTTMHNEKWQDKEENADPSLDFNLDDFLKSDAVPDLLPNGPTIEGSVGSKFSRWFHHESPIAQQPESRRSSIQGDLISNMIGEITEPNIVIPSLSESNAYFTPISPAANTSSNLNNVGNNGSSANPKPTLLEMLQRGGQGDTTLPAVKPPSIRDLEVSGKVHSVEELEARMRQECSAQHSQNITKNINSKKNDDMSAFNKLLAQISDGKVIPATAPNGPLPQNAQQINFTQLLKNSQEIRQIPRNTSIFDQSTNQASGHCNTQNKPTSNQALPQQQQQQQQMQIPKELVMKLLQVQQQQQQRQQQQHEMFTKLLSAGQQTQHINQGGNQYSIPPLPPSLSPLPPELQVLVNNAQPSRELLQRPEAKAILQGLRYGEITSQHLVQQLQNPAMQHRHREVLISILKMQMQQGVSPRTSSPHPHTQPPDLLHQMMLQQQQQQHQQQQLRIPSPLNNVLPRVPSPRELIVHTQNIMQSALIKKKLEEQRENYRKRQELQQSLSPNLSGTSNNGNNGTGKIGDSPSPAKHLSSPTPLAFTPTSVLRKMTAEKESDNSVGPIHRTDIKVTGSSSEQMKSQSNAPTQTLQHRQPIVSAPPIRVAQTAAVPWNIPKQNQGRPIVKGNGNFQYPVDYQQQQQQQQQQPQQQRHNPIIQGNNYNNVARSKMTIATPTANIGGMSQQLNSLMMMHRPRMPQSQTRAAQLLQAQIAMQQQQQQQQQRNITPSLQQMLMNQNYNSGRSIAKTDSRLGGSLRPQPTQPIAIRQVQGMGVGGSGDMSTSPTSNQLARWFSPELLAQARAGQLPDMPPIPSTQNMLSLEELERLQQSSAAVHN